MPSVVLLQRPRSASPWTFFTQSGTNWGVMAGSTLITVPVMLFLVAVQRRLAPGLAGGAVKG